MRALLPPFLLLLLLAGKASANCCVCCNDVDCEDVPSTSQCAIESESGNSECMGNLVYTTGDDQACHFAYGCSQPLVENDAFPYFFCPDDCPTGKAVQTSSRGYVCEPEPSESCCQCCVPGEECLRINAPLCQTQGDWEGAPCVENLAYFEEGASCEFVEECESTWYWTADGTPTCADSCSQGWAYYLPDSGGAACAPLCEVAWEEGQPTCLTYTDCVEVQGECKEAEWCQGKEYCVDGCESISWGEGGVFDCDGTPCTDFCSEPPTPPPCCQCCIPGEECLRIDAPLCENQGDWEGAPCVENLGYDADDSASCEYVASCETPWYWTNQGTPTCADGCAAGYAYYQPDNAGAACFPDCDVTYWQDGVPSCVTDQNCADVVGQCGQTLWCEGVEYCVDTCAATWWDSDVFYCDGVACTDFCLLEVEDEDD